MKLADYQAEQPGGGLSAKLRMQNKRLAQNTSPA
jgi:hypothetical protein